MPNAKAAAHRVSKQHNKKHCWGVHRKALCLELRDAVLSARADHLLALEGERREEAGAVPDRLREESVGRGLAPTLLALALHALAYHPQPPAETHGRLGGQMEEDVLALRRVGASHCRLPRSGAANPGRFAEVGWSVAVDTPSRQNPRAPSQATTHATVADAI